MESAKEVESDKVKNETEQSNYPGCLFNKVCDISNGCMTAQDDLKIKVEIELKEEENGMIYQPDLYGHLRLVNLNQSVLADYSAIDNEQEGKKQKHWSTTSKCVFFFFSDIFIYLYFQLTIFLMHQIT